MLSLLIFLVFSWAQIIEPASSLHLNSDLQFASASGNEVLGKAFLGTDELQLFQRGLENQKGNKGGNKGSNKDAEQIPTLDARKAISSIGQMQPLMLKTSGGTLTRIINTFRESPLSELFAHIKNLISNPDSIKQYPRIKLPSSDAFENDFTREALLVAVGELSNENVAKGKQFLQNLKRNFRNKEMDALFTNIMALLENQPTLRKYKDLCEDLDKSFELDKTFDVARLGLPVPTEDNPVVYFELKDDENPSFKFLVKVKMEEDQIVETILIKTDESGLISSRSIFTASNDENGLEELYKKLPISKLVKQ